MYYGNVMFLNIFNEFLYYYMLFYTAEVGVLYTLLCLVEVQQPHQTNQFQWENGNDIFASSIMLRPQIATKTSKSQAVLKLKTEITTV